MMYSAHKRESRARRGRSSRHLAPGAGLREAGAAAGAPGPARRPPREAAQISRPSESECMGLSPDNERRRGRAWGAAAAHRAPPPAPPAARAPQPAHADTGSVYRPRPSAGRALAPPRTFDKLASAVRYRFSTLRF